MEDNRKPEQGFDSPAAELSEESKEALQSETWKAARKAVKTEIQHFTDAPEIQHFAVEKVSKNDNVYGVAWGNAVREYLKTAYCDESAQTEIISFGTTYKVLKRENVTAFYDADGNTLFDVENGRLEKEYAWVMKEDAAKGKSQMEAPAVETSVAVDTAEDFKEKACEKLRGELKKAEDTQFAEPVIGYLLERCGEDSGLAQDVMQEHKTWEKCLDYIYKQAKQQAQGNRAAVRDNVVYEWAEDYYHRDDKAEEEKKAREKAERRKKEENRKKTEVKTVASKNSKQAAKKEDQAEKKPDKVAKPKKNTKDMEGQMDLFSMMGL